MPDDQKLVDDAELELRGRLVVLEARLDALAGAFLLLALAVLAWMVPQLLGLSRRARQ